MLLKIKLAHVFQHAPRGGILDHLLVEALRRWREKDNVMTQSKGEDLRIIIANTTILQQPLDVTRAVHIIQPPPFRKTEYLGKVLTCGGGRKKCFLQPPPLARHVVQQPRTSRKTQTEP